MSKSQSRSYIAPRKVGAITLTDVSDPSALGLIGIGIDNKHALAMSGMDALEPTVTIGSNPVLIQALQTWLPGFVKVITGARKADQLVGVTTVGEWHKEEVVQGVMELTGTSHPYGDYTNIPLSSWNINFERRSIVRFEEGMQVGTLEEARASEVRVNAADEKRNAAALALEIQRNRIAFYGYNNGDNRTYGILNDPALPAYVTVDDGASGDSKWSTKTFLEMTADIRSWMAALRVQSQDQIDPKTMPTTMAMATECIDRMSVMNDLGSQSVTQWLATTYPLCRPISAPELNGANGGENVAYVYAENFGEESSDDGAVMVQIVPAKFQVLGVKRDIKHYVESYTNATAGVMVKRPWAVYRASGI